LGIGDWGLGIGPNPQSPIPNPQLNNSLAYKLLKLLRLENNIFIIKNYYLNNNNIISYKEK